MEEKILVRVGADISDFSRKMADANKSLTKFTETNKETFDSFKQVGSVVTGAGVAIGVGLGASVKVASDFQSAFAGVRKTVDTSEAGFQKLEAGIRDMAKELPASANEIAAVAEAAGQLGIAEENILGFSRTMIDLGEATNLTADEAASALAQFANVVQMPQENFDRLGSTIVALGNTMATTEADIVNMAMRLSGVGAQVGLTEADIMALSASMASVGINAEAGGSAMSTVMKKIQNAVGEGGKSLEGFAKASGMTSKEFAEAFNNDPITAIDAFVKGLGESGAAGENLNAILGDLGIKGIQESDTLLRLAGASDVLGEAVKTASGAWDENSALTEEAAQRYETFESKLAMLKNTFTDLGITIGGALLPYITNLVERAKEIVNWFSQLDPKILGAAAAFAAIASVVMTVGGALLVLVGFIPQIISGFGAVMTVVKGLGAAFTVLTGPVGLVIAAIAGIIAVLVLAYKNVDEFRDFVNKAWEKIKDGTVKAFNAVMDVIKKVISAIVKFGKEQLDKFKAFWEENGTAIKELVKVVFNEIKGTIEMVMGIVEGIFQVAWPIISGIVTTAWELIKTTVSTAIDLVLGIIQTGLKLLQGDWKGAWESIKDTAETIMNNIVNFFRDIDLVQVGKDIIQGLINGIGSMTGAIQKKVSEIANGIPDGIKKILGIASPSRVLMQIGRWTGEGLAKGISATKNLVGKSTDDLAKAAVPNVADGSLSDTFIEDVDTLSEVVVPKLVEFKTTVLAILENLYIEWAKKIVNLRTRTLVELDIMKRDMHQLGVDSMVGMINGLESMRGALMATAQSIANAVKATMASALQIHSPSRWMRDFIGKNMMLGWIEGMNAMQAQVVRKADEATNWMTPAMPRVTPYQTPSLSGVASGSVKPHSNGAGTGGGITQNLMVITPEPTSPSENARKMKQAARELAYEWGV